MSFSVFLSVSSFVLFLFVSDLVDQVVYVLDCRYFICIYEFRYNAFRIIKNIIIA